MAKKTARKTAKKATRRLKKVRLALIGAGGMANKVHYPSLAEMADVELAALCDLDEQKLEETADFFDIGKRYTDYRKMLDEVKCNAVYALMPPHHVFDVAVDVLKRGHNLFIEKPPGVTTFQARTLAAHARKNKCLTMVGFNRRFAPLHVLARKIVEKKAPVNQIKVSFHKFADDPYYYDGVIDIIHCDAIHAVDTLRWLGGEVAGLASTVSSLDRDFPVAFNAVLRFESGALGILSTNWRTGRRYLGVEIHSPGASAYVETEVKASIYTDNDTEGVHYEAFEVAKSDEFRFIGGYYGENRHFIDCVKAGRQPSSNFADAAKTMDLADRICAATI